MEPCPCGGEKSKTWHLTRKLPMCSHIKTVKRNEDQERGPRPPKSLSNPVVWKAGTSIYIPEYEEP